MQEPVVALDTTKSCPEKIFELTNGLPDSTRTSLMEMGLSFDTLMRIGKQAFFVDELPSPKYPK